MVARSNTSRVASFLAARTRLVLVALLAASFALATPAVAADQMSEIRLQMDRGQALYLSGKYEEAAEVFESSFDAYPYSAFLFNAGVSYQKAGQREKALRAFERYVDRDPQAPDRASVDDRIAQLRAMLAPPPETPPDGPAEGPATPAEPAEARMKSLVVIESDPPGAPVRVFERKSGVGPYAKDAPGYELVHQGRTPGKLSLGEGRYHIIVDKFAQFNESETDIDITAGQVHVFKANLSQGAFLASLRVASPVLGAKIYLDEEPGKTGLVWGTVPFGDMVPPGQHRVRVSAPGYQDFIGEVTVVAGEQKELVAELPRLEVGILRIDANAKEVWVSIDGKPMGTFTKGGEALNLPLPAGTHEVLVRGDGLKDLRETVEVRGGEVAPLRARMMKTFPRGAAIAQGVIALGLIGASTYFALESDRLHSEVRTDRENGSLAPGDSRLTQGFWYSIGADAGFGLGGIFALLSVYNFVRDPYPESQLQRGAYRPFDGTEVLGRPGGGVSREFGRGLSIGGAL